MVADAFRYDVVGFSFDGIRRKDIDGEVMGGIRQDELWDPPLWYGMLGLSLAQ